MKILVIALFALTYVLMLSIPSKRHYFALTVAAVYIVLGVVAAGEAFYAVDWNIIMMLFGTMGTVYLFIESKMPNKISEIMINKLKKVKLVFIVMALFAGLVSAFIDNVATVLMLAPIAVAIAKKFNVSPVKPVLAVAVSSNLQGAATLVGDTTSILLGGYANMDFLDFFFMDGKLGMFFIVQAGALATIPVLYYIFRNEHNKIDEMPITKVTNVFPSIALVSTVVLLIAASFFQNKPAITNGIICITLFAIALIYEIAVNKTEGIAKGSFKSIDFQTLLLLGGLFIIIQGITNVGLIEDIGNLFVRISGDSVFLIYTILVWFSVLVSAFIDNIPYVATMLPVVSTISAKLGVDPTVLYFGLLAGATLGGNITPVGASA
ncbi:MAG: arsenic transporter, partial [Oscillospiraceae bacterium]|nr:arsenic transporter [Oscillospiraceae bacterium]